MTKVDAGMLGFVIGFAVCMLMLLVAKVIVL